MESQLDSLPIGEEFIKIFLIFMCVAILAPNSKPEGMHDLWDFIWDIDVSVLRNWEKLMVNYLEDGIQEFKAINERYVQSVGHGALKACNLYCFMKTIFYI